VLLNILLLAALLHVLLLSQWIASGVDALVTGRYASVLVMHAMLRGNVSDDAAAGVASRIQNTAPGVKARVIGQAEARGMLAKQEPWMLNLPNVEISRVPVLIEVRLDPILEPAEVRRMKDTIASEPEVDIVIFNDNGLDDLVTFSRNVQWYTHAMGRWISGLLFLTIVICGWQTAGYLRWGTALPSALAIGFVAVLMALYATHVVVVRSGSHHALPALSIAAAVARVGSGATLWVVAHAISAVVKTRRSSEKR
jgi:hypothetical protein